MSAMPSSEDSDGLGQNLWEDLVWMWRFRRARGQTIPWRRPTPDEDAWIEAHPELRRFGDFTVAVADFQSRFWLVRERVWSGWPDPPAYAAFALEGEVVWMGRDFEFWPKAWARPDAISAFQIGVTRRR